MAFKEAFVYSTTDEGEKPFPVKYSGDLLSPLDFSAAAQGVLEIPVGIFRTNGTTRYGFAGYARAHADLLGAMRTENNIDSYLLGGLILLNQKVFMLTFKENPGKDDAERIKNIESILSRVNKGCLRDIVTVTWYEDGKLEYGYNYFSKIDTAGKARTGNKR
ncbi:hypothetical protein M1349_03070 [Patescibacteria group bacterium]|nr:hypothetical protein [Patescibacteria group bacterium]